MQEVLARRSFSPNAFRKGDLGCQNRTRWHMLTNVARSSPQPNNGDAHVGRLTLTALKPNPIAVDRRIKVDFEI